MLKLFDFFPHFKLIESEKLRLQKMDKKILKKTGLALHATNIKKQVYLPLKIVCYGNEGRGQSNERKLISYLIKILI